MSAPIAPGEEMVCSSRRGPDQQGRCRHGWAGRARTHSTRTLPRQEGGGGRDCSCSGECDGDLSEHDEKVAMGFKGVWGLKSRYGWLRKERKRKERRKRSSLLYHQPSAVGTPSCSSAFRLADERSEFSCSGQPGDAQRCDPGETGSGRLHGMWACVLPDLI